MLALVVAVGTVACSPKASTEAVTGHVTTMDAAASKACDGIRLFALGRAGLSSGEILARVATIYSDVQGSANPVIRARAVALYVDAEQMAEGAGPGGSFEADLAALQLACRTPSG